ncbi:DUF421 domain-containing protein [Paracoccus sp. S-4012]|nr:DUF421 domain-containing protein [Paracoccus sp. S-4012]
MFRFEHPLWLTAVRASIAFLGLIILVRVVPQRNAGNISPNDMLVLVVIGAIGGDAIMGGSASLGDLLVMVSVVLLWGYVIDLLELRFPAVRRVMKHKTSRLVADGRLLRRNMRREMVTEDEIMAVLRSQGIGSLAEVESAILEADGEISLLRKEDAPDGPARETVLPFDEADR